MQFNKDESGALLPLAKRNVDTGMGLERTTAVLQGKKSVYETELFTGILARISLLAREEYDAEHQTGVSMRIIADHLRSSVMIISDGIEPSNKDQGYILRRLVRRAIRHARKLNIDSVDLVEQVVDEIIASLRAGYPILDEQRDRLVQVLLTEAAKFDKSVQKGLKQLQKLWDEQNQITGKDAFDLYQSYGFPLELTEEIASEYGQKVERQLFESEFVNHQELSRAGAGQKFAGGLVDDSVEARKLHTATHLLHQALRDVLGDHVEQKGSNITQERLRFDFSHPEKMTDEQKKRVEDIVNAQIDAKLSVHQELLTVAEAKKRGAIGLFEDKYESVGDQVKVYFIGDYSSEICGGPHVENTAELGHFTLQKEEASSAGIRRIKAILG